jgi:hypothetical protein
VSEKPAPRHVGDVGGSAPGAALEVTEGVLRESAVGIESAVIAPPLQTARATVDAPPLHTAEAALVAPPPSMVGRSRKLLGRRCHRPPSPSSLPRRRLLRLASPPWSPKSTTPPRGWQEMPSGRYKRPGRVQARPCREMSEVVMPGSSNSPASHGRPLSR